MTKQPNRLWIVVLLLGWMLDFLFWKKPAGVNFPVFAALCLLGGLFLLLPEGLQPARKSCWLVIPLAFFSLITIVRREPLTSFLGYTITLFILSLFAITYLGGRWIQYRLSDYFTGYLALLASLIGRPLSFSQEAHKLSLESGQERKSWPVWPVLRGIVIALPIVAVFAALLASADVIFNQQLNRLLETFRIENIPEYIFRLAYILFAAYLIAAVILHAASQSKDEKLLGEGKPFIAPFLGFTESSIVLGSVAILFLAFVVIQFQYFFGGHANIRIDGYTYSEYARRGFGELVTVAFFTLLLLLGLGGITRREASSQRRAFSALGVTLVVLVLVMLVSAYQRLVLYEQAYGFSRLRAYTHVALVWIALLLIATILLEVLRREQQFAFIALVAALGFSVSLSLLNVDRFIVRQNVERELVGHAAVQDDYQRAGLDAPYLMTLSEDAVPALVQALQNPSLPVALRDRVGAALACIRYERGLRDHDLPWQSFHFSSYFADRSLARVSNALAAYSVQVDSSPLVVTTRGAEYPCTPYHPD